MYAHIHTHTYVCMYTYIYIYVYVYRERERGLYYYVHVTTAYQSYDVSMLHYSMISCTSDLKDLDAIMNAKARLVYRITVYHPQ